MANDTDEIDAAVAFRDEKTGTFDDFIKHLQVVVPAIHQLQDSGLSRDYIERLFRFIADWIRDMDDETWKRK